MDPSPRSRSRTPQCRRRKLQVFRQGSAGNQPVMILIPVFREQHLTQTGGSGRLLGLEAPLTTRSLQRMFLGRPRQTASCRISHRRVHERGSTDCEGVESRDAASDLGFTRPIVRCEDGRPECGGSPAFGSNIGPRKVWVQSRRRPRSSLSAGRSAEESLRGRAASRGWPTGAARGHSPSS